MMRGYSCLQLHDKTLSWYEDMWAQNYVAASLHSASLSVFMITWPSSATCLEKSERTQRPHLMKWRPVWSPSSRALSGCLRKGSMEEEWFFCPPSQLLGSANQAVPGETRLWGIRPFGPKDRKIQWMSCPPWYFHITHFSTVLWTDIPQAVQRPQIHVITELKSDSKLCSGLKIVFVVW